MGVKGKVLHVGCSNASLPIWFSNAIETRLDIDPSCNPDVVASILDMGEIGGFDCVYSCHVLEHIYPHQVQPALKEFKRVLKDGGHVMIFTPDLEDIKANEDVIYEVEGGVITGWDLFYGGRSLIEKNPYMAHRTGFTTEKMKQELEKAGFRNISITRLSCANLMSIGVK